jgi:2-dehydropantoate 2-reductase
MPAITVIGPGAIGGMIAARLCQNSHNDVTVVARTPFERLSLMTPDGELRADPRIVTGPGDLAPADWVLVATKAYDSASAAKALDSLLSDETCVAVLQNGVNHVERFSEFLPRERVLPVVVDCPTERVAAGEIRQRGPAVLTVPAGDVGSQFEVLFSDTGVDCKQTDDFISVAWWKLCVNAAGVVNALVLQPARIAHDEGAAQVMRRIVDEAAAVGRAEGARLPPDIADEVVDIYRNQPPDSVNSLHADRAAGRPMEIDLRNGIVAELGRKHGIETPCNEMAVSLLKIDRTG